MLHLDHRPAAVRSGLRLGRSVAVAAVQSMSHWGHNIAVEVDGPSKLRLGRSVAAAVVQSELRWDRCRWLRGDHTFFFIFN